MVDMEKTIAKTGLMAVSIGLIATGAAIVPTELFVGTVEIVAGIVIMLFKYGSEWVNKK